MSLISIAQRETFHISFVQFVNKGYGADLSTSESYYIEKRFRIESILGEKKERYKKTIVFNISLLGFSVKRL